MTKNETLVDENSAATIPPNTTTDVCGRIFINKSSQSPIEFNLRGLIDNEYILSNNLNTRPGVGLNKQVLLRYNTSKNIGKSDIKPAPIEIIQPDSKYFKVYDTINGTAWRQLSHNGIEKIHRSLLSNILEGISTRASDYNKLLEPSILMSWYNAEARSILDAHKKQRPTVSSDAIRDSIVAQLGSWFRDELTSKQPKTERDVKLIKCDNVSSVILNVLTSDASVRKSAEFTLTYLYKYDEVLTKFTKELKYKWNLATVPGALFIEYDNVQTYDMIAAIFKRIVREIVDMMDKSKMWTSSIDSLKQYYLEYNN